MGFRCCFVIEIIPSALWDENSNYPRFETIYAYTEDMIDKLVEKFTNRIFNQGSAVLKIK